MTMKPTRFSRSILIKADDVAVDGITGEIKVGLTSQELHVYLDSALRTVITADQVQTLTNKTIDADNNTVSNLEVDNLKAGVLNTDVAMTGASDTQVPSALAIKTYVDNKAAAQDQASEITYSNTTSGLAATNTQAALDEIDANLDAHLADATDAHDASAISTTAITGVAGGLASDVQTVVAELKSQLDSESSSRSSADTTLQTNIDNHVNDTIDAHDASAISNTPAGTIAATDVQSAINELDTDIQGHITDTVDAHDASAISNIPAGNLAATDVQGAVNELQGDIDTINANKVTGPASATDNAVARFDGTTGKLVQNSGVTISDTNDIAVTGSLTVDSLNLDGSTITGGTSSVAIGTNIVSTTATEVHNGAVAYVPADNAATGANAVINAGNNKVIRLTDVSLSSIDGIVSNVTGQEITLINRTGNDVTLNHDTGATAAYRIYTGTGAAAILKNNASMSFVFDGTTQRWNVVGGTGAEGGSGVGGVNILFSQTFDDAALADFTQTGLVLETTAPLHGSVSAKLTHDASVNQSFKQVIAVDEKFRGESMTMAFNIKSGASAGNVTVNIYDETNAADIVASESITLATTEARQTVSFTIPATCLSLSYTFTALPEAGSPVTIIDDVIAEISAYSLLETSVEVPVITEWQSYTPTFTGFGTPSAIEAQWRQNGENHEYRIKFTSGTPTATEARVSLANGATSAGTDKIPSIQLVGYNHRNSAVTQQYGVLIEPSVTYFTFDVQGSFAGLTKQNGDQLIGAGQTFSFFASVPISGLSATETKTIALTQSGIVQEPDSMVRLDTANGYGSTATKIRRFSNIRESIGSDIIYADSATNGASFTVLTSGLYNISYADNFTGSTVVGISKNASSLTANYTDLSQDEKLTMAITPAADLNAVASVEVYLNANDVIRAHTNGTASGVNPNRTVFIISKQGSLKQVNVNTDSKITIPTSELRFEGASSLGSTATAIVKFDTLAKIRGDAFTVTNTAADGTYVTMTKAGKLDVSANVFGSSVTFALSKNQSTLTGLPTATERLATEVATATTISNLSWSGFVAIGDVVRLAANGTPTNDAAVSLNLSFQEQDIQVSVSNTLPQFSESDSSVRVDTANGYGSTATKIARFSNIRENIGTDIEYSDSSADGSSFTVRSSGIYDISFSASFSGTTQGTIGISRNSSQLTTDIQSITVSDKLTVAASDTGDRPINVAWSGYLVEGDIIRPHTQGGTFSPAANALFTMSKVGKPNVTGVDVTPFVTSVLPETDVVTHSAAGSTLLDATGDLRFTVGNLSTTNKGIVKIEDDSANTRTKFVALKKCKVDISVSATQTLSGNYCQIRKNGTSVLVGSVLAANGQYSTVSGEISLESGEYITIFVTGTASTDPVYVNITAEANSENIITPSESFSTDTASLTYASSSQYTLSTLENAPVGTFITFTYAGSTNTRTQTTTAPTQTTSDMNVNGIQVFNRVYGSASTAAQPSTIAIQIGKGLKGKTLDIYKSSGKTTAGSLDFIQLSGNAIQRGAMFKEYNELTGVLYFDVGYTFGSAVTTNDFYFSDLTNQSNGYLVINASKSPALVGVPQVQPRIATIKDVKASGTVSGSATAGTWNTRTLNTLDDPTGIITSLSANEFILPAGTYFIEASAPATRVNGHRIRLYNVTDSTSDLVSTTEYNDQGGWYASTRAFISGKLNLTSSKSFRIDHHVTSAAAGTSTLGHVVAGSGEDEVYTQVKITKVK